MSDGEEGTEETGLNPQDVVAEAERLLKEKPSKRDVETRPFEKSDIKHQEGPELVRPEDLDIRDLEQHQVSSEYQFGKQTPDQETCERFVKQLNVLRRMVELKIRNDPNAVVIPTPRAGSKVDELLVLMETVDGVLSFRLNSDGVKDRLRVIHDKIFTTDEGESLAIAAEELLIEPESIDIYHNNYEEVIEENDRIFIRHPEKNEVDESTSLAIERAEKILRFYLNSE